MNVMTCTEKVKIGNHVAGSFTYGMSNVGHWFVENTYLPQDATMEDFLAEIEYRRNYLIYEYQRRLARNIELDSRQIITYY